MNRYRSLLKLIIANIKAESMNADKLFAQNNMTQQQKRRTVSARSIQIFSLVLVAYNGRLK